MLLLRHNKGKYKQALDPMQSHNLPNIFHVFNGHQSLTQKAAGNAARVVLVDVLPDIDDSREITSSYIKHRQNNEFDIRWFNHGNAIQRCGHGTLAAAAYINNVGYDLLKAEQASMRLPVENPQTLIFHSDKETLFVRKEMSKNTYSLHLPIESIKQATHHSLPFHCQRLFCTQAVNGYLIAELDSVQHIESFAMTPSIIEAIKRER